MSVTQTADGRYTFEHPTLGSIAGLTQSGVDQMQSELAGDPRQAAQLARRNPPPPAATPPSGDRYTFEHPSVGSITGLTQSGLDQMNAEVYGAPATSGETGQNQAGGYQPVAAQSPGITAGADFFDAYRRAQDSGGTFRTGDMRYGEYQGGGGGGYNSGILPGEMDVGRYFPPRQQPMPPGYRNPYAPSPFYQQRFDQYAPMMPQGGGGGGGYFPRRGSQFPGGGRYGNQNMGPIRGGGMGQVIPTNIPFRDQGYGAPMLSQNLIQSLSGPNNLMNPYRRDTTLDMLDRFRGGGGWGGMPNDPYYGDPYYGGGGGGGQPGGGKGGNLPQVPTDQVPNRGPLPGDVPETQTPGSPTPFQLPPPGADGRYTFTHPTDGDITGLTEMGWRQMELEVYGPSGRRPPTGEAPPPETKAATGSDYGITAPGGYEYKKADWDRFTAQGGIDTNQNRRIDPDEYATYKALIASRVASRQTPPAENTPPPAENTPPPETQVATGSDYGITGPGGYEYKKTDWDRFTSQGGIDTNENRRIDPDEYATYKALIASRVASREAPAENTPPPATGGTPPPAGNDPANPYNHSPEVVAALIAGGIDPATFNPADIDIGNIGFARGGHVGLGSMFARGGHVGAGNLGRRPASNLHRMLDQLDLRRA